MRHSEAGIEPPDLKLLVLWDTKKIIMNHIVDIILVESPDLNQEFMIKELAEWYLSVKKKLNTSGVNFLTSILCER